MKILDDNFMVCADCIQVIANGDYTSLDYYYPEKRVVKMVIKRINEGIDNAGGYIALGDNENDEEFSSLNCDCCNSRLAGTRHHCIVLEHHSESEFRECADIRR